MKPTRHPDPDRPGGASGSGVDRQEGIGLGVLAAEERPGLGIPHPSFQPGHLLSDVGVDVLAFGSQVEIGLQVFNRPAQPAVQSQVGFQLLAPLQGFLRLGLVRPKGRIGDILFQPVQFLVLAAGVKDSSVCRAPVSPAPESFGSIPPLP